MSYKETKSDRVEKKPPSPKQLAVRKYGRRLFAQGSTMELARALKELGYHMEASTVMGAIVLLRTAALAEYENERLRLDPEFETRRMQQDRLYKEWREELAKEKASQSTHNQWS